MCYSKQKCEPQFPISDLQHCEPSFQKHNSDFAETMSHVLIWD